MGVGDGEHRFRFHVAANDQRHVGELIEARIAAVEQLGRDLADRGGRAADVAANAVMLVHRLQKTVKATVGGGIVVHSYFLGNNTHLAIDRFFRKIRVCHKIEKLAERFLKAVGTAEEVRRFVERGIRIGIGAVFRKALKGVASVLVCKELML